MICKDCRIEADLRTEIGANHEGRSVLSVPPGAGHDACKGGTHCDCQHKVPDEETGSAE